MSDTKAATKPRSVLAAGYVALDTLLYGGTSHHAGGTAANVAAILKLFGWDARVAAVIGNDRAGRALRTDLTAVGVSTDALITRAGVTTPQVIHEVTDRGHRFLFSCPSCGRRLPRSRPLMGDEVNTVADRIEAPDVFFFDRANSGTLALADIYGERGALVMFEPNSLGAEANVRRAAGRAHLVKLSDDRRQVLWSALPRPRQDQAQIVTRGAHGASVRIGRGKWRELPAFEGDVVDAGGAGDWTTAGLLAHLSVKADERDLEDLVLALRHGQAYATLNCRWPGARGLAEHLTPEQIESAAQRLMIPELSSESFDGRPPARRRRRRGCEACLAPSSNITSAASH